MDLKIFEYLSFTNFDIYTIYLERKPFFGSCWQRFVVFSLFSASFGQIEEEN